MGVWFRFRCGKYPNSVTHIPMPILYQETVVYTSDPDIEISSRPTHYQMRKKYDYKQARQAYKDAHPNSCTGCSKLGVICNHVEQPIVLQAAGRECVTIIRDTAWTGKLEQSAEFPKDTFYTYCSNCPGSEHESNILKAYKGMLKSQTGRDFEITLKEESASYDDMEESANQTNSSEGSEDISLGTISKKIKKKE